MSLEDAWPVVVNLPEQADFFDRIQNVKSSVEQDTSYTRTVRVVEDGRAALNLRTRTKNKLRVKRQKFRKLVRSLLANESWRPDPKGIPSFIAGLAEAKILSFPLQRSEEFSYVYAVFGCVPEENSSKPNPIAVKWQYKMGRDFTSWQLSATIFGLAAAIAPSQGWEVSRAYLYFKDFLVDQVKVSDRSVPAEIRSAARDLLAWTCGIVPDAKLEMLAKVCASYAIPSLALPAPEVRMRIFRVEAMRASISDDFYDVQPPTESHEARSSFHVNKPNLTLSFPREKLSPLNLQATMLTLPYMFEVSRDDWRIVYDARCTYITLTVALWKRIVYAITPSMTLWDHTHEGSAIRLRRKINYSVAPFLAHALCYGDVFGKLAACRGLVGYTTPDSVLSFCSTTPHRIALLPRIFRNLSPRILRKPYDHENLVRETDELRFNKVNGCFYAGLIAFAAPEVIPIPKMYPVKRRTVIPPELDVSDPFVPRKVTQYMTLNAYEALRDLLGATKSIAVHEMGASFASPNFVGPIFWGKISDADALNEFYRIAAGEGEDPELVGRLFSGIHLGRNHDQEELVHIKKPNPPFVRDSEGENAWKERIKKIRRTGSMRLGPIAEGGVKTMKTCARLETLSTIPHIDRYKRIDLDTMSSKIAMADPWKPPDLLIEVGVPITLAFPAIIASFASKSLGFHPDLEQCVVTNPVVEVRHYANFIGDMDNWRWPDRDYVGYVEEPKFTDLRLDEEPQSPAALLLHDKMDDRTEGEATAFRKIFSEMIANARASGEYDFDGSN